MRLRLKNQIMVFNRLLQDQFAVMNNDFSSGIPSMCLPNGSNSNLCKTFVSNLLIRDCSSLFNWVFWFAEWSPVTIWWNLRHTCYFAKWFNHCMSSTSLSFIRLKFCFCSWYLIATFKFPLFFHLLISWPFASFLVCHFNMATFFTCFSEAKSMLFARDCSWICNARWYNAQWKFKWYNKWHTIWQSIA